jgi:hypothetical protein
MTPQQLKTLILADSAASALFAQKQDQQCADREQLWRELASIKLRLGEMD